MFGTKSVLDYPFMAFSYLSAVTWGHDMEILRDNDTSMHQLMRHNMSWKRIGECLQDIEEIWLRTCSQFLGTMAVIERADTDRWQMNGTVLTKKFSVAAVPRSFTEGHQQKLFAQLLISVDDPFEKKPMIVAHVLIDRDGTIYSSPAEPAFSNEDSSPTFMLLVSIINHVLAA